MAKLSKALLGSLLLSSGICSDFRLISCNNKSTGRPELSYAVTKAYIDKNMSDQKSSYTLSGSYYYKTVKESDLSLQFSDSDDVIKLSYAAKNTKSDLNLDGGFGVIFSSNSVILECNYKRSIDITSSFETGLSPAIKPIVGNGSLGYKMKVTVGNLGGRTSVYVEPNHAFSQIYPRVIECKVVDENGKNEVNLIHSMDKGAVCIDKSRFDAKQTQWYPRFAFDYRSFRYKGDSDTKQKQTIKCKFHLDPRTSVSQPKDCSCHHSSKCTEARTTYYNPVTKLVQSKFLTYVTYNPSFDMTYYVYFAQHVSGWRQILQVSRESKPYASGELMNAWYDASSKRAYFRFHARYYVYISMTLSTGRWYKFQLIQNKQQTKCQSVIMLDGRQVYKSSIYTCSNIDSRLRLYGSGNTPPAVAYIRLFKFQPISETTLGASRMLSSSEQGADQNSTISSAMLSESSDIVMFTENNSTLTENSESTMTEVDGFKIYNYEWDIPEDFNDFIDA